MENASKALIIAGAILLSILLIGLGVFVYNGAAGTIQKANLNAQEIKQYNAPFEAYEGTNVSGSKAIALCNEVRQHNLANQSDLSRQITVITSAVTNKKADTFTAMDTTATTVKGTLRSGYTYTITFGYDPATGLMTEVSIIKN